VLSKTLDSFVSQGEFPMIRAAKCVAALALSFALAAVPAHATTLDLFSFTSPVITGPVTAFIPASPTPTSFVPGVSFDLSGVTATFEGNTFTGDVTFFSSGGAGGGGTKFNGPLLFSGPDSAPTFLLGSFPLSGIADIGNGGPQQISGTLTISQTPEPLPVMMTGTGVFALLLVLRRRRSLLRSGERVC
jgi:hypothetical protein